jgi:hypothetical protein
VKLPNAAHGFIPEEKLTKYLLSMAHPVGRSKAVFFLSQGFSPESWPDLAAALVQHAEQHEVAGMEVRPEGTVFRVDGPLSTPGGRTPLVRSIWILENGVSAPRFVTAYALTRKKP